MRSFIFCFLFFLPTLSAMAFDEDLLADYPHVILSNGILEAPVFLPDPEKGFYRSTRFDWSGIPCQITYQGHTYFMKRPLQRPHNPNLNGHAMSLAEEFDIGGGGVSFPQRFSEAKPGETFMKIAVGNLEKTDDGKSYAFSALYRLVDTGKWTTRRGKNWIEFTHTLHDNYGFAYIYTKRMELLKGKPELIISHSLKNTGKRSLSTTQYCHNFFIIDGENIGRNYHMHLSFIPQFQTDLTQSATIRDSTVVLEQNLEKAIFSVVEGFGDTPAYNRAVILNTHVGAGVEIKGDIPLTSFHFYAEQYSFCPELFVKISVEPGKTQKWKRYYRFFTE